MNNTLQVKKEGFGQVVVWPSTTVGADQIEKFEGFMKDTFNVNVQYLGELATIPDFENGVPVKGSGGRNDLFFALEDGYPSGFCIQRLNYGMSWLEDFIANGGQRIHAFNFTEYGTWDATTSDEAVTSDFEDEDE